MTSYKKIEHTRSHQNAKERFSYLSIENRSYSLYDHEQSYRDDIISDGLFCNIGNVNHSN